MLDEHGPDFGLEEFGLGGGEFGSASSVQ